MKIVAYPVRECRRMMVTRIVLMRGEGIENDPVREVVLIFDDEGVCLAEHDPVYPTPWYAPVDKR
jgi:hypothetical protein